MMHQALSRHEEYNKNICHPYFHGACRVKQPLVQGEEYAGNLGRLPPSPENEGLTQDQTLKNQIKSKVIPMHN